MRDHKHILVSITYQGVLHWRLISAKREGKHWQISSTAYDQFLKDIGRTKPECRCGRCGSARITLG